MMEAWASGKLHGEPAQKLLAVFDWHEAHVGPRHGSANRLGIGRIALAGFSIRFDALWSHQADRVSEPLQLPGPKVGTAAGLHAHQARWKMGEKWRHLFAPELLSQHRVALLIHAVELKHGLFQVDANSRNVHFAWPLSVGVHGTFYSQCRMNQSQKSGLPGSSALSYAKWPAASEK
jgi:hypothetical protein